MDLNFGNAFAQSGNKAEISKAQWEKGWPSIVLDSNGIPTAEQFNAFGNYIDSKINRVNSDLGSIEVGKKYIAGENVSFTHNEDGTITIDVNGIELFIIVKELPDPGTANPNKIYLVPSENSYDEYIAVGGEWERFAGLSIDLSNFYTKNEMNLMLDGLVRGRTEESPTIGRIGIISNINGVPRLNASSTKHSMSAGVRVVANSDIFTENEPGMYPTGTYAELSVQQYPPSPEPFQPQPPTARFILTLDGPMCQAPGKNFMKMATVDDITNALGDIEAVLAEV